jgi:hypothetical protein
MKSLNYFTKKDLLSVSKFLYTKLGFGTANLSKVPYHTLRSKTSYAKNLATKRGKISKMTWGKLLRTVS